MSHFDAELVPRPSLLLTNSGEAETFEEAAAILAGESITVVAGCECGTSSAHQSALLTAVNTAGRAVGHVSVVAAASVLDAPVLVGPTSGSTIADALARLGATPGDSVEHSGPALTIGTTNDAAGLRVTWEGWIASIQTDANEQLAEDDGMPLTPIVAAALGVSEVFQMLRGHPEAARRAVALSLWDLSASDPFAAQGPRVQWLPGEWALIGLGHLGQAYGWCISLLPYAKPRDVCVQLQDDDVITKATLSTGLLTFGDAVRCLGGVGRARKTRVAATELERAGLTTMIVERRLGRSDQAREGEPQLALMGVDNLETRRLVSDIGWRLCIDVGLGRGAESYTNIRMQVFPGHQSSAHVAAWMPREVTSSVVPDTPAYAALRAQGVDECGLVTIADKSAAVTFVGVVAACIAIADPVRALAGGPRVGLLTINLASPSRVRVHAGVGTLWRPPAYARGPSTHP